jgi:hypothetical protein
MLSQSYQETVKMEDQWIEITVSQRWRTVWVASGDYLGKHYETQLHATRTSAIRAWQKMARYHGHQN